MPLSENFHQFYRGWSEKAAQIDATDYDPTPYFDKFFTLFVLYNRLYAEATFTLERDGRLEPLDQEKIFPDALGKKAAAIYLGDREIVSALESDQRTRQALHDIERILEEGHFLVLLEGPRANGNRRRDEALLRRLRSQIPRE